MTMTVVSGISIRPTVLWLLCAQMLYLVQFNWRWTKHLSSFSMPLPTQLLPVCRCLNKFLMFFLMLFHDSTSELPEVFRYLPLQGQLHPLLCDGDAGCDSYLWGDHLHIFKRLETSSNVSQKSTFLWRSTSCVIESYACLPKPQENLLDHVTWNRIEKNRSTPI